MSDFNTFTFVAYFVSNICCIPSRPGETNSISPRGHISARIITNSSFDAPGIPLAHSFGWKTIQELIAHESESMAFKSIHGLAPQYMSD